MILAGWQSHRVFGTQSVSGSTPPTLTQPIDWEDAGDVDLGEGFRIRLVDAQKRGGQIKIVVQMTNHANGIYGINTHDIWFSGVKYAYLPTIYSGFSGLNPGQNMQTVNY